VDRAALVSYRIDDGRKLLNRLLDDGLEVSAAFWMYTTDNESWGLYIASPSMESIGIKASYMILARAMKELPGLRIDSFEVTLLEPTRPLAAAIIDYITTLPAESDAWIERTTCNGVYVEIAYIYPGPTVSGLGVPGPGSIEAARHLFGS
jgi:hypothetical protein